MLLDQVTPSPADAQDVALLRLVCLVRSGDGYLIRAVARLEQGTSATPTHVDISFGAGAAASLESVVRHIQRWCDEGTTIALVEAGARLALRGPDGTEVPLPAAA